MNPKQSAIRKAYEKAGFIWDEVGKWVNESGDLILPNPNLKYEITGYGEAIDNGELKGITLTDSGLWLKLESLRGLASNNGWTRIDGPDDLPKEDGFYMFLRNGEYNMKYRYDTSEDDKQWFVKRFTHWRPVEEIPEPVY